MTDKYNDIIHQPYPIPGRRKRMSPESRAAQFAPFAALVGYGDAIDETIRQTDSKSELSEEAIERINLKLAFLAEHLLDEPTVSVTYFVPDKKKSGGAYRTVSGIIDEIDDYECVVRMSDKTVIPMNDIAQITGECFDFSDPC